MPGQPDPPLSETDHVEGPADAPATLVVYGDFPAFFVNGTLHEGSFDAGSLVEALEAGAAAR